MLGRTRIEWEDYMRQIMGKKGGSLQEMERMAKDREVQKMATYNWHLKGYKGTGKDDVLGFEH